MYMRHSVGGVFAVLSGLLCAAGFYLAIDNLFPQLAEPMRPGSISMADARHFIGASVASFGGGLITMLLQRATSKGRETLQPLVTWSIAMIVLAVVAMSGESEQTHVATTFPLR